MRWAQIIWVALLLTAVPASAPRLGVRLARAQPPPPERTDHELVLRPSPDLGEFAERVAQTLSRRGAHRVSVGEQPPGGIAEAVPEGHVALQREDGRTVAVAIGLDRGVSDAVRLDIRSGGRKVFDAEVRAVALAVEGLLDGLAESTQGDDSRYYRYTYVEYDAPERGIVPAARPAFMFRFQVGHSPTQEQTLVGPGMGVGLCVYRHCAFVEADLPLFAETRRTSEGRRISYHAINFGVRFLLRPFDWKPITPGVTFGLISRVGNAAVDGATSLRTGLSNLGLRSTLEVAWRFVGPLEAVMEVGADYIIDRAVIRTQQEAVFVDDELTPWGVFGLRVRP